VDMWQRHGTWESGIENSEVKSRWS
jgi:hypothetical protein